MKLLITGAHGYIGSALLTALRSMPEITLVGVDSKFFTTSLGQYKPPIQIKQKDIRDITPDDLLGVTHIIHLAAISNDPMGALNPQLTLEINHQATITLARLAKEAGVQQFVFSSSCSVYGIADEDFVTEQSSVHPQTAYAESKILAEHDLASLASDDFKITILRNATVFGYAPQFRSDLVVNDFTINALLNHEIEIKSDGTPWRPLIDVRDLASIFIQAIRNTSTLEPYTLCNIGFTDSNFQVAEIAEIVSSQIPNTKVRITNEFGSDTRSYRVDFSLMQKIFPGVRQHWPLAKSVADLATHIRAEINAGTFSPDAYVRIATLTKLTSEASVTSDLCWRTK